MCMRLYFIPGKHKKALQQMWLFSWNFFWVSRVGKMGWEFCAKGISNPAPGNRELLQKCSPHLTADAFRELASEHCQLHQLLLPTSHWREGSCNTYIFQGHLAMWLLTVGGCISPLLSWAKMTVAFYCIPSHKVVQVLPYCSSLSFLL